MSNIISTIEITLIILLPVILMYRRNKLKPVQIIINVMALYVIWYITYALMHELCHLAASRLMGLKILDYQLIPHFWAGDYSTGYVKTHYDNSYEIFITCIMPYIRDIILAAIGFIIINRVKIRGAFLLGLVIVIMILSPLYDMFNNYFAYVIGSKNDFNAMSFTAGVIGAHLIGIIFTAYSGYISWYVLLSAKNTRLDLIPVA